MVGDLEDRPPVLPALELTRTFNSADPRVGAFGQGWTHSYDMTWNADAAGNITVLYPDGRRETRVYPYSSCNLSACPAGSQRPLVSNGNDCVACRA